MLGLVAALAMPKAASAQIVCEYFTGDSSPGAGAYRSSPWGVPLGTFPYAGLITLENAGDFYIQAYPTGEESVYVPGSPADLTITPVLGDGISYPTYFSFWLLAGAGDADVVAYDASNNIIFSHTVLGSTDEVVTIDGVGEIARIEVDRGDNETWIDDLCLAP